MPQRTDRLLRLRQALHDVFLLLENEAPAQELRAAIVQVRELHRQLGVEAERYRHDDDGWLARAHEAMAEDVTWLSMLADLAPPGAGP